MKSLLQQLENNEAILLMYLADELPAEDRLEVEQLLENDGALRQQLVSLEDAHQSLNAALSEMADFALPPATRGAREAHAARQISRMMVRVRLEQQQRPAAILPLTGARTFRLPSWTYPFAAAAMIILGCIAYWGFTGGAGSSHAHQLAQVPLTSHEPGAEGADRENLTTDIRQAMASLPSLGIDEGDRDLLAVSAGSYDVGSMFQVERE
jgi:anti-sigma factor RsiW